MEIKNRLYCHIDNLSIYTKLFIYEFKRNMLFIHQWMLQYLFNCRTPFFTFFHFNKMKFLIIMNINMNLL